MAMGKGDTIINGLPASMNVPMYRYQSVFAPRLANDTVLDSTPNVEQVLSMDPDVVMTTEMSTVQTLENKSIPVIYMGNLWSISDNEAAMNVLGQVYNDPARAKEYSDYCNAMLTKINSSVASVPVSDRPRALILWASSMNVFNGTGWIDPAGGVDAFDPSGISGGSGGVTVRYSISMEQLLKWNPDIIVVCTASDVPYLYNNTVFSTINAVKNHQVYVMPVGAFRWYQGPEYPLMIEWTASKFYPDKFPQSEIVSDMKTYYKEFFNYQLTDQESDNMLKGMQNVTNPSVTPAASH